MTFNEYKYLILSDLYRVTENVKARSLVRHILLGEAYRYIFWMRTCRYTRSHPWLKYVAYPIAKIVLHNLTYKLGISISPKTDISSGFYIGHCGGVVINDKSVIGKNCNISHDVTVGQANRGTHKGCPVLGDNIYIGPGAKLFGAIRIGNNVAIGANCVVTKDVPDNSVVVGIPARIISMEGSDGYINKTDYDRALNDLA